MTGDGHAAADDDRVTPGYWPIKSILGSKTQDLDRTQVVSKKQHIDSALAAR
jgi:hypothetical protein